MKKRCLIATGGGDCPGLNAVIRAIVKRSRQEGEWEVIGSCDAFNGVLQDPMRIVELNNKKVAGIHVQGGTILGTTNKGGPFNWIVPKDDGTFEVVDRSDEFIQRLRYLNVQAVINIGGDGSQAISQKLFEKGIKIIGVPKTIDNDLSCTDYTFGFSTAVDIATDAVDKLVTTAASHHRVQILEVMGRDAGWIALYASIAGGAEVCLIPEIPYDLEKIKDRIADRIGRKGFLNIVIAEGATPKDGTLTYQKSDEVGRMAVQLGGVGFTLMKELKKIKGMEIDCRVSVLGHLQRGGIPSAFDRILATRFGVKAFEMVLKGEFGRMVAFKNNEIVSFPIKEAISDYNFIDKSSSLVAAARGVGINLGD